MKKRIASYALFFVLALSGGIIGSIAYNHVFKKNETALSGIQSIAPTMQAVSSISTNPANFTLNDQFILASNKCKNSVVFVKSIKNGSNQSFYYFDLFSNFFSNPGPSTSQGSGVIVSADGYIITNNHVVKDADRVEVVVSGRKKNYKAEIIGVDPSSDLALLKIDESNLPFAEFANSDLVQVGEWVLAVGNPFNLTSTVTGGIVSAKGRNINVTKNNFPIESFIQTDAAINPGNSGGALVNLDGKVVGINTAILSQTGSYAGYGFAIPANIVVKIIKDFKEFGLVQRAFIEAEIIDIDERIADKIQDISINGVYVNKITENGNAYKSGIQKGDIIIRFNGVEVPTRAVFDEQLAYLRPGDKAKIEVLRENKIVNISIPLTNSEGNTELLKNTTLASEKLGASFMNLSKLDKDFYGIDYGVKVINVKTGLLREMSITNGFIILYINNAKVTSAEELIKSLEGFKGWLTIKGISPEGWMVTRSARIY